ncbi:RluA family pseudouridine synthase [candidate division WWE3 bacterium]|nr:RluA family pseudouridine synthase [candidate division WWE3 bacterium]
MQDIEILFQNEEILVINKPAGITVNRSETTKNTPTVQDFLIKNFPLKVASGVDTSLSTDIGVLDASKDPVMTNIPGINDTEDDVVSDFVSRNGIVHRLDKDTSGVLVIAKTEAAFNYLQAQFKSRTVLKDYFAYAIGEIADQKFEINAPLARNPKNRLKMAVIPTGRVAVTLFEKDHIFELNGAKYTALRVFPKTGRTHQIRVHLAALNHPIAGDFLYAGQRRGVSTRKTFGRLMLHAHQITFVMPSTEETRQFKAPIPKEFAY